MTRSEAFCLWLTGYTEDKGKGLSTEQVATMRRRLAEVFETTGTKKVTEKPPVKRAPPKGGGGVR